MASPRRGNRRSRSREKKRSLSRERHIKRSRISPPRERKRSRSRELRDLKRQKGVNKQKLKHPNTGPTTYYNQQDLNGIKNIIPPLPTGGVADTKLLIEQEEMKKLMGFATFDTTKNKHVEGNIENRDCINKVKKRKYRQYMNRKGGFNRPLDYVV